MARPIQLRYDDVDDGETVIGTYLTNDNLIQQASMKNSGSGEYTRLEIKGSRQLKDNLPIDYTQYGTSEPEILVYVRNDSGNWELRDRVFAEDAGTIDDKGNYRNDKLWGFQKWVGRQKTPRRISLSNATVTEVVDELLPSGYVAQTPGDDTVPTLENYTFNGKIDRGIRDLVRDFPVKIWFSPETDGSGNYIVKVQSKGYGDVVQTITFDTERQTEGYQINSFEEEDKSNVVNKVEIEGVDSNGNKIQEIVSDSTSINEHGERYVHRNVGYLDSTTQAQNIANDILSPQPSPHAHISIPFQDDNILNASIDILDDRYGIDAVYTVVKQRDYFTEGRTEVELGFEKNRSEERRDRDRELDERNHQLFPSGQDTLDIDLADFNPENDTASSDNNTDEDSQSPDTSGSTGADFGEGNYVFTSENFGGRSITAGVTDTVTDTAPSFTTLETQLVMVDLNFFIDSTDLNNASFDVKIENTTSNTVYFDETFTGVEMPATISPTILQQEVTDGDTIETEITYNDSGSYIGSINQTVDAIRKHDHLTTGSTDSHLHNVLVTDNGHGAPGDPSTHDIIGDIVQKVLEVLNEEKTDR